MRLIGIIGVALLLIALIVFLGWPRTGSQQNTDTTQTLRIVEPLKHTTLDPQQMHWNHDLRLAYALFQGLTIPDQKHMTPGPGTALRWEISTDRHTYTFYLDPKAKWSDGSPVTAEDFAFAWWLAMLSPDNAAPYSQLMDVIAGAQAFKQRTAEQLKQIQQARENTEQKIQRARQRIDASRKDFDTNVHVKVLGPHTLEVKLEKPTPWFLELAGFPTFFPLHRPSMKQACSDAHGNWRIDPATFSLQRDPQWTAPDRLICNGPYLLDPVADSNPNVQFLKNNPHYLGPQPVHCKTVQLRIISNKNTAYNEYQNQNADVIFTADDLSFAPALIADQQAGKRKDVHPTFRFGTYYLKLNCRDKLSGGLTNPLADPRVRRALAMAIDKQQIVSHVTRMNQPIAGTFIPPNAITGYPKPESVPFDPKQAAKLLAGAGYPEGRGFPEIELLYNTGSDHQKKMLAIRDYWKKHLGLRVRIEAVSPGLLSQRMNNGDFMVARAGWIGDYGDPTTFLNLLKSGNGHNEGQYANPEYDHLLEQASNMTGNPNQRLETLAQAEQIIVNRDLPIIPIYHYMNTYLFRPEQIQGICLHPRAMQLFGRIRKK